MKYTGKALIFALVLCLTAAAFVGCVGPESDDGSNTNGETSGTATTQQQTTAPQTQAPTTNETGSGMMDGVDSVVDDVSDAIGGDNTTTTEATTTTPARARGMRGRDGK